MDGRLHGTGDEGACRLRRDDIICLRRLTPHHCRQDPQEIVNAIRELGAKNCIMVTDGGDVVNPNHVQMLRAFYTLLLHYGISKEDLTIMLKKKPAELLDLE